MTTNMALFLVPLDYMEANDVYNSKRNQCPKNLTFPKAERDQRCPHLVVVIFCLFISIKEFDWFTLVIIHMIGRLKKINK